MKNTVVQFQQLVYRGWHRVNRQEELLEVAEEVGDDRAERSSAIGDGEQAAVPLTPDGDGMHIRILEV